MHREEDVRGNPFNQAADSHLRHRATKEYGARKPAHKDERQLGSHPFIKDFRQRNRNDVEDKPGA